MQYKLLNFKSPLIPLCLLILIDHIGYGILYPILVPLFMDSNGILGPDAPEYLKSLLYNVTLSIFPITLFFGATFLGSLSDQFGRKKVLLICIVGAVFSYLLAGLAVDLNHVPLLIFSRFIAGLTAGSMPIAQAAIIDISEEENRSVNLGYVILAASLGFLVGPLIGGFFANPNWVSWFRYSTPFYVAAVLAFVNVCFLLGYFQESHVAKQKATFRWSECIELSLAPFKFKEIRFLSLIFFLVQLGWGFYFQFVSVYLLKRFNFSSQDIGFFMTIMGIGFAIGSCWALRILTKFFKEITVAIVALCVTALACFLTLIDFQVNFYWLPAFLMGVSMAVVYSLMVKFYSQTVSEDKQGWIMGVSEAVISVAFAVTPLISSYLENINLGLPIQCAFVLLGLGSFLLIFWKVPKTQERETA